ncbi:hypothetical protein K505DRAFT_241024 [Melanomma pulvis-pyrius CBS 109.77]|uniref:Uncharacterized protein n=1 Tax=Melanomma pulvis-pyrius CBS 109.77 TaxID=1314802 RepID=A0A6A6XGW6_9PLEO|nr:hypothetical protein K505DRAFT_241024 [Melanomma pulvis-pyrius CBS 109.77]
MSYSAESYSPYSGSRSPPKSPPRPHKRSSCQLDGKCVEEDDVVQGRIFWLPPKAELPEKAVRRAHGKGVVEEGIYNHPVVVVSRPADERNVVHFHLITSFQGKKLHEIYSKNNEFHASRRSWYLPIYPTPEHPDANSKKAKKRYPTLALDNSAVLRWDSYVNLRHVYKIEWSYLRPYANPDTPNNLDYRFERESLIRMLAKGKLLTTYETGTQYQGPISLQIPVNQSRSLEYGEFQSPRSETASISSSEHSALSPLPQWDFLGAGPTRAGMIRRPPSEPPDGPNRDAGLGGLQYIFQNLLRWPWLVVRWLWARLWARTSSLT